ncbi:MAG: hypothetical protein CXT78_11425 [Thaumarchaeota archaeon]|jgi:lysophospholipase L1-like esterase|nr:MAG: hypothetical protein CXT78_11425 [Nitrososphaerota archaeon]
MNENIKISLYVGVAFLISIGILFSFLEIYSTNLLNSEKSITDIGNIFSKNPKHITLDVLRSLSRDTISDSININSLGFRGDEFFKIKPDNTYRIFMVGGSTIFGTGTISDDSTIPKYLEYFLKQDQYRFNVEVINSGIQGADSFDELKLIENRVLDFTPDMVIVYDGWNDLRSNYLPDKIVKNWNLMCQEGQKNNFEVIIVIQAIAGFSNKVLSEQELEYLKQGKDYNNKPLINSLKHYEQYADKLQKLNNCTKKIDLRFIFDKESDTIYLDQGHTTDKGNKMVAESIHKELLQIIPKNLFQDKGTDNKIVEIIEKESRQSTKYTKNEIDVIVQNLYLDGNGILDHKVIKISTIDKTNNIEIPHVTYFLNISKDGNNILSDYFYVESESWILDVYPNDSKDIVIHGDRQYEHNAFVIENNIPIKISGPIFDSNGTYEIEIELRTIYEKTNWVFSLDGFKNEIIIES